MKKFFARIFFKCYDFFAKIPKKTYETCAIILLAVVLVVDLGYHLITSMSDKLETAPAKVSSLSETLSLDALILRDEMPLEFDGDRYLVLCEYGERVNNGAELIREYPQSASEEDLAALSAEMKVQLPGVAVISGGTIDSDPAVVRGLVECDAVIMVEQVNRSAMTAAVQLKNRAKALDKPVLGCVMVG